MNSSTYIKISTLENAFEAQVVASILVERHIPHTIRSYHDTAYDGLFQFQKGWGAILAPSTHQEEIREILSSIRSGNVPAIDHNDIDE